MSVSKTFGYSHVASDSVQYLDAPHKPTDLDDSPGGTTHGQHLISDSATFIEPSPGVFTVAVTTWTVSAFIDANYYSDQGV